MKTDIERSQLNLEEKRIYRAIRDNGLTTVRAIAGHMDMVEIDVSMSLYWLKEEGFVNIVGEHVYLKEGA